MRPIDTQEMHLYNLVVVQELKSKRSELSLVLEKEDLPVQSNEVYKLQRT
jgi:hypothetical protein